ncbi:MAG: 2'-5' RNA ligase family protein [Elainellaceae cyanobacterium]
MSPPLILTLKLDQQTFEQVNKLRQQYYPPGRNIVPAHITLFHALPGDQKGAIEQRLQMVCSQMPKISLHLSTLRFLGRGTAIEVSAPELVKLQQTLAETWHDWLKAQDRQAYRPHITIQNKVAAAEARQGYEHLMNRWQPWNGYGEGLLLWYYRQGPWEFVQEFSFIA